jgi:hypothetical protein
MSVKVDGTEFPSGTPVLSGREIAIGPAAMSGLNVTRKIHVSATSGWARWVDLYENPTAADITVGLIYEVNPGSDGGTTIIATSSGDAAFTTADSWVVTDDSSDGGGDPTLNHNLTDGKTLYQPTSVSNVVFDCAATNGTRWDYASFTVPAFRTLGIMTLLGQNPNRAAAQTNAAALNASTAGLDGLSAADRGAIVNRLLPKSILFVSDSTTDNTIPTALTADGHVLVTALSQYSSATGATAALTGSLVAYDAVFWSATGSGFGALNNNAAMIANLETYVAGGGRVFVTGYDSVASPSDPVLAQFVGGTGPVVDVPSSPDTIANVLSSLTYGLVDTRGATPTGGASDRDALVGLAANTVAIVRTSGVASQIQWAIRPFGLGEIAYVSNGNPGVTPPPLLDGRDVGLQRQPAQLRVRCGRELAVREPAARGRRRRSVRRQPRRGHRALGGGQHRRGRQHRLLRVGLRERRHLRDLVVRSHGGLVQLRRRRHLHGRPQGH